jgi:ribosomal protein L37E
VSGHPDSMTDPSPSPSPSAGTPSCLHMQHNQWGFCTECGVDIYQQTEATQARSRHLVPDWLVAGLAPSEHAGPDPTEGAAEDDCPHDMAAIGVTPRHGTQWQCRRCGDLAP